MKQNSRTDEETEGASRISTNSSSKELDNPNIIRFDFLPKNLNSSSTNHTTTNAKKRENVMGIRGVEVYKKFDN